MLFHFSVGPANKLLLYFWLALIVAIVNLPNLIGAKDAKQELQENFAFDSLQLRDLNSILLRLKEVSYREVYGDRQFSHDSAVESKKDVTISDQQAKTSSKLLPYLFEGDILLSPKQANAILETALANSKMRRSSPKFGQFFKDLERQRRAFTTDSYAKWDRMPIRYRFADSIEFYVISQIIQAIDFWQENTCITFVHDDQAYGDYIQFFRGEGCYSVIGRLGGMQSISIGKGCERLGTLAHEIGHALGLWHQQSRPDADEHVEIIEDYILKTYIADFKRRDPDEIETFGIPYDLGSVMHYGSTAFSFDDKTKTLITKDPNYQQTIGQREKPSFYDVKVINNAYCKDICKKSENGCKNGGYQNPSNCDHCLCPSGFGGPKCETNEAPFASECGGLLNATDQWQNIESPGYPDPGYDVGERCSWIISAKDGYRIEFEFVDDFSMLCTTTCVDFVELKTGADLSNTGYRFCCEKAKGPLVSYGPKAVVIFYSTLSDDLGFRLRYRLTTKKPNLTESIKPVTTTEIPTTIMGENIWSEWGSWSECTRPCGACGIQTRTRLCKTAHCVGKNQQFANCNFNACKIDPRCEKIKFVNRLCGVSKACVEQSSNLPSCGQAECCPPFSNIKGICQSNAALPPEFVKNTKA